MFVITTPTEGALEKIRPGENGFIIPFDDEEFFVHLEDKDIQIYEEEEIEFSMQEKAGGIFIYDLKEVI